MKPTTILASALATGLLFASAHVRAEEVAPTAQISTCSPEADDGAGMLSHAMRSIYRGAPQNCPGGDRKLPPSVVKWLGSKMMRQHHYLWHLVRTQWSKLPDATRAKLKKQGWEPPRQQGEKGSGMDFLCMHHEMIQDVNRHLAKAGDACYKEVEGWNPIPFDPKDKTWPMPSDEGTGDSAKSAEETARYQKLVGTKYSQDAWLKKTKSLDALGLEFETGIHGWMHMHWATENGPADPMKCGATNAGGCDWLGTPFTAHVNPVFWKLHGWIEERAQRWAELHHTDLDTACKGAFAGPTGMDMGGMDHGGMAGMPHGGSRGMPGDDDDFDSITKDLPPSMTEGLRF